MASTSGANAELELLQAKLERYEAYLEGVMAKILYLEQQQQPTDESREELKRLQQKEQSLLDLITKLQEEKNLLRGSSTGAAAAGPAAGLDAIEEALLRALKRHKSSEVSISSFGLADWNKMSASSGLQLKLCPSSQLCVSADRCVEADTFRWTDAKEPDQADRYMPYLKEAIPFSSRTSYPLVWCEGGAQKANLLDTKGYEALLHYSSITGNTDVAIITRDSYKCHTPREGLCVLFELKKAVKAVHVYKASCQQVLASLASSNLQPITVLTDLAEDWQLFWLDGLNLVHGSTSRGAALAILQDCVHQAAVKAGGAGLESSAAAVPAVIAERKAGSLPQAVQAAAVSGLVHPELLSVADQLPADELQNLCAHALMSQVSAWPTFSGLQGNRAYLDMYS